MAKNQQDNTVNLEELRGKYDKIYTVEVTIDLDDVTTEQHTYHFKKPTMASYDRFVKMTAASPTKASLAFVLDAVVQEDFEALRADLDEYPAMVMAITDKLFALLGLSKDISIKKS